MQPRHALLGGSLALVLGLADRAQAQHHGGSPDTSTETHESMSERSAGMPGPDVLGLPMTRHGSGTGWLPDSSPMRAFHARFAGWDVMVHGNVFVGYDHQGSDAGDGHVVSQNWLMAMADHALAGGVFEARAMVSLEPLTVGDDGYPLLLQTGETSDGEPLVDRQHPHDLFMELAVRYAHALGDDVAFEVYTALAGEPALGPVAFPHRPSAMADPFAPIAHHWLDSTHISFGVVTAGVFTRTAKLEGSWFNGREPDEGRFDLDLRTPDSYATRLSVNPSREWSLQASYAYLASPESLEPDVAIHRVTASATQVARLGKGRWSSTAAFGHNHPTEGRVTSAFLVETALDRPPYGLTFLRAEYVQKTGHDFALPASMENVLLPVSALSLGHVHPVLTVAGGEISLGVRAAVGYVDADLESRYGTRMPLGFMAYLQVQPAASTMRH